MREDLLEWDYGDYEGLTTPRDPASGVPAGTCGATAVPGGERAADVGARADRVIAELIELAGLVAVFSHGHTLRVLGARWIGLGARARRAAGPRHRRALPARTRALDASPHAAGTDRLSGRATRCVARL